MGEAKCGGTEEARGGSWGGAGGGGESGGGGGGRGGGWGGGTGEQPNTWESKISPCLSLYSLYNRTMEIHFYFNRYTVGLQKGDNLSFRTMWVSIRVAISFLLVFLKTQKVTNNRNSHCSSRSVE